MKLASYLSLAAAAGVLIFAPAEAATPPSTPATPATPVGATAPAGMAPVPNTGQTALKLQSLDAANLARMNRPVTLVFANATTTDWLNTLSKSANVPLNLDPVLKMRTLAPLSVVASHAPFYPLLLQIATAEGLGISPAGEGFMLYQLSPEAKQKMGGLEDYVNTYGGQYGYNASPVQRPTVTVPMVRGDQPPGATNDTAGKNARPPAASVLNTDGGENNGFAKGQEEAGAVAVNSPLPAITPGGSGGGALPGGIPRSPAFQGNAAVMAGGGFSLAQPNATGPVAQKSARSTPAPAPLTHARLGMEAGMNTPYGAEILRTPQQNSINLAVQPLLVDILEYAQGARRELAPPDQIYPELTTSAGSLQYLAVVVEAFNHLPHVPNAAPTPIAVARLRSLLGRAEAIHQRACHREELQTEILILRRRLPTATDPVIHGLLNNILQRRENELGVPGP